jgi:replicative DNA helicase
MQSLYNEGKSVDLQSLLTNLSGRGEIQAVGGAGYVLDLTSGLVSNFGMETDLDLLKEAWKRRELRKRLELLQRELDDPSEQIRAILTRIETDLLEVEGGDKEASVFRISSFLVEEMNRITREQTRTNEVLGIPTGLTYLDTAATGWRDG